MMFLPQRAALPLALSLTLATALAASAQDDPVVAEVDGTEITRSELEADRAELPQQYSQAPLEQIFPTLRDRAIDGLLLTNEAERRGLGDDQTVKDAMARARQAILRNVLIEHELEEEVTDEKIEAAYEELKAEPGFSYEEVSARHILVEQEDEAKAIIEELDQGADFAELAKEKSTGPSAPSGGDLGFFRREQMVAPFADAAFGMEVGSSSEQPVQTQFGWHVIKVEDKRQVSPSLEEKSQEIRENLAREAVTGLIASLRDDAEIQRYQLDGSPADDDASAN
ncbi:MAG: peptidylprolyl isomerase [Geminicoccaceae bacterium]